MADKRSFWTSVPATLTGTAALVTAIVGLLNRTDGVESKAANPAVDPAPVHVVEERQPSLVDRERETMQLPDIGGIWRDTEGTSYVISQTGAKFTVQEITPHVGVTAQGEGVIADSIRFIALTSEGANVTGELQVSINGSQMSGHYTDSMTGDSLPLVLRR